MNYLFFDIESPNGHPDAMCEFGYVLLNRDFKIIKEKVILINPERLFKVLYLKNDEITLKFKKQKYYDSPTFDKVYPEIKSMLLNKDNLIFGFSVGNDQCYVLGTSKRYRLKLFDFVCYDVQTLYCKCKKVKSIGLDKMAVELLDQEEIKMLKEHYSVDDAKVTSLCFLKLLKEHCLTLDEALKLMGEKHALQTFNKLEKNKQEKLEVIRRNRKPWDDFVKNYKINSRNRFTCMIYDSVFKNKSNVLRGIRFVKEHNYIPTNNIKMADIFVVSGPKELRMLSNKISLKNKKTIMVEEIKF